MGEDAYNYGQLVFRLEGHEWVANFVVKEFPDDPIRMGSLSVENITPSVMRNEDPSIDAEVDAIKEHFVATMRLAVSLMGRLRGSKMIWQPEQEPQSRKN